MRGAIDALGEAARDDVAGLRECARELARVGQSRRRGAACADDRDLRRPQVHRVAGDEQRGRRRRDVAQQRRVVRARDRDQRMARLVEPAPVGIERGAIGSAQRVARGLRDGGVLRCCGHGGCGRTVPLQQRADRSRAQARRAQQRQPGRRLDGGRIRHVVSPLSLRDESYKRNGAEPAPTNRTRKMARKPAPTNRSRKMARKPAPTIFTKEMARISAPFGSDLPRGKLSRDSPDRTAGP